MSRDSLRGRPVRSYIGRLVAEPGRRFLHGGRVLDSARFNAHADAVAWTEAMQAGPIAARKVIASVREPEIVRHCPDGDPGSVGGVCPGCGRSG
jgi:hypothetical protein